MLFGLSRVHFPVTTLGPGNRLGIWFQGCTLRCRGCISTDTWPKAKQLTSVEQLLEHIRPWLIQAEGITISGGEPFQQPDALLYLLKRLKQISPVDTLVYSGFKFADIAPIVQMAYSDIDGLITEPFDHNSPNQLALRGSDNQTMHLLTELGKQRFAEWQNKQIHAQDNIMDIMFDDDGTVWLAGIPRRDDFLKLQQLLGHQGHQIVTTADHHKHKHTIVKDA